MTKSEIEKLIEYIDNTIPKRAFDESHRYVTDVVEKGVQIYCKVNDVFDLLRDYPTEMEKISGPNYEAMYKEFAVELEKEREKNKHMESKMCRLTIESARYAGAVSAMETIFGRKFDPNR